MNINRREFSTALAGLGAWAAGGGARAHPPDSIELSFDMETKLLDVKIAHFSSSPEGHFIESVTVSLDGEEIITQKFKSQISRDGQEAKYLIPDAKAGAKIKLSAACNIKGKLEKEITV